MPFGIHVLGWSYPSITMLCSMRTRYLVSDWPRPMHSVCGRHFRAWVFQRRLSCSYFLLLERRYHRAWRGRRGGAEQPARGGALGGWAAAILWPRVGAGVVPVAEVGNRSVRRCAVLRVV